MAKKGKAFIGTSGFHYKHWVGTYYPENTKPKDFMKNFLKDYRTVELNNPFYHLPPKQTFLNWRKQTPEDFLFSVKASRYITHQKKLKDCQEPLDYFLTNVNALKEKLGPILFQLPPGWKYNEERFESFLKILPKGYRFTFEFRNQSWYNESATGLLKKRNCAFCIYELAGHMSPMEVTADFIYVRLHGPGKEKYQGSYSDKALKKWAEQIKEWKKEGKDVYCYFDNDQYGYAAFNGIKLWELISK
ncbi:MAG: DUF72 domain-containing protein [Cytophagaceae bacterium]|nr:DUF72 domain-containing protein [Cytophagaceae bacterium]